MPSPLLHICALLPKCSDILFQWCSGSVQTYLSIFSSHYAQKRVFGWRESFFYSGKAHLKLSGWKHNCVGFFLSLCNYWIHVYWSRIFIAKDVVNENFESLWSYLLMFIKLDKIIYFPFCSYSSCRNNDYASEHFVSHGSYSSWWLASS